MPIATVANHPYTQHLSRLDLETHHIALYTRKRNAYQLDRLSVGAVFVCISFILELLQGTAIRKEFGALFVSDSNKGKIYKVGTDGKVSDFCVRAAGSSDSYTYLALYSRDSSFGPNESTPAKLAFAYTDWATASAVYQVTSIAPPAPEAIQLNCNGKIFHAGDRFALSIAVQPTTQPFDAYVVFRGPGVSYSLTPRGLVKGVKAYAVAVPVLRQAVTKDLLDMPIPAGVPAGTWTIYAGLMPKGTAPSPTKAFALDSVEVTVK